MIEVYADTPQYYERNFSPVTPDSGDCDLEEGNWNCVVANEIWDYPWRSYA